MLKVRNKGYELDFGNVEVALPERVLTATEEGYLKTLQAMGMLGNWRYPHPLFEVVDDPVESVKISKHATKKVYFFRELLTNYKEALKTIAKPIAGQDDRITMHGLQITKNMPVISPKENDLYVKAQIEAGYKVITILDENKRAHPNILKASISRNLSKILEAKRIPRVMLETYCDSLALFKDKVEAVLNSEINALSFPYRSYLDNKYIYSYFEELSHKDIWLHMTQCRRYYSRRLPVSLPAFLSAFGLKSFSLGIRGWGSKDIHTYGLFDEETVGVISRAEQTIRYGDTFNTKSGFPIFNGFARSEIYNRCHSGNSPRPLFAYEATGSKYELNESSKYIRTDSFGKYVEQKECLKDILLSLGVPY